MVGRQIIIVVTRLNTIDDDRDVSCLKTNLKYPYMKLSSLLLRIFLIYPVSEYYELKSRK